MIKVDCPECGHRSSNKVLCASCGIVYANYFERKREMRQRSLCVAQQREASRKRNSVIISTVLLTSALVGLFVFAGLSKEHLHKENFAENDTNNIQKLVEIEPAYQKNASKPNTFEELDSEEQVSSLRKCSEGNCFNGVGTYIIPKFGEYSGTWKEGKRHGQGTFTGVNGSKYVGEWKNDKEHGQGTLIDAYENKYVGEWEKGKRHGQGILIFSDGSKYEGEFLAGKRHGYGTFTNSDLTKYVGEWKDGKIYGHQGS